MFSLLLLVPGIDITARDEQNKTALSCSIAALDNNGNSTLLEKLLMSAVMQGHSDIVGQILEAATTNLPAMLKITYNAGKTALMHAVLQGDADIVGQILEAANTDLPAMLEIKDNAGKTALMHAVLEWRSDIVGQILEAANTDLPAMLEIKDNAGKTALMHAVLEGQLDIVRQILGAPVPASDLSDMLKIIDGAGKTALMHAVLEGQLDIVGQILEAANTDLPAMLEIKDNAGKTALMHAVLEGQLDIVGQILEAANTDLPAMLKIKDNVGKTALMHAVLEGRLDIVGQILEAANTDLPAMLKIKDNVGKTALMHAVLEGRLDIVGKILEAATADLPAMLKIKDNVGKTALMHAVLQGKADIVGQILGAPVLASDLYDMLKIKDNAGKTALMHAAEKKDIKILALFLKKQATIPEGSISEKIMTEALVLLASDSDGIAASAAIRHAVNAKYSAADALEIVVKKSDASVAAGRLLAQDPSAGTIALNKVAQQADNEKASTVLAKSLLALGIAVNTQDDTGKTALMHAAKNGNNGVVRLLLKAAGVSLNTQDNAGNTAFIYAAKGGFNKIIIKFLRLNATNIDIIGERGKTAFEWLNPKKLDFKLFALFMRRRAQVAKLSIASIGNRLTELMKETLVHLASSGDSASIIHLVRNIGPDGLKEALKLVAKAGNVSGVKALLAQDHRLGLEALTSSVVKGCNKSVVALLGAGVEVTENLLHEAAKKGNVEVVRALMQHSTDLHSNRWLCWGHNALSNAVVNNKLDVVKFLAFYIMESHPSKAKGIFRDEFKTSWRRNFKYHTASYNFLYGVVSMLDANRSLESADIYAWSQRWANEYKLEENKNAEKSLFSRFSSSVSMRAKQFWNGERTELPRFLSELGYNAAAEAAGRTVFTNAAFMGNTKAVKELLSLQSTVAKTNFKDRNGSTALDLFNFASALNRAADDKKRALADKATAADNKKRAVDEKERVVAAELIAKADKAIATADIERALITEVLELFLQRRAETTIRRYSTNANCIPAEIMTEALVSLASKIDEGDAIAHAVELGYRVDKALIEIVKRIDITNEDNSKECDIAAIDASEKLLEQDNNAGIRVLRYAASNGDCALVQKLLVVPKISVNCQDEGGKTALMHAAANNKLAMVRQLLAVRGIEVGAVDSSGKTALMYAMECRHISIAECLLEVNKSPNAISKDGRTAFDFFGFTEDDVQAVSLVESFLKKEASTMEHFLQRRAGISKPRYFDTESRIPAPLMAKALINLASRENHLAISHAVELGYKVDDAFKIAIGKKRVLNAEIDGQPVQFEAHATGKDNNSCGFHALPIANGRAGALRALLGAQDNAAIRALVAPEIRDVVLNMQLPREFPRYDEYQQWRDQFFRITSDIDESMRQALDMLEREGQDLPYERTSENVLAALGAFSPRSQQYLQLAGLMQGLQVHETTLQEDTNSVATYVAFITHHVGGSGELSFYADPQQTSMLDALAQVCGLRVSIWQNRERDFGSLVLQRQCGPVEGAIVHLHHSRGLCTHYELLSITNTRPLSNSAVKVLSKQDPAVALRVLMEAASVGDIYVINTLLEMSRVGIIVPEINIDAPDENGKTALIYAVERGHSSIVASLLGVQEQNQTSVLRLRSCLYRILATTQGEDQTNAVRVLAEQNTIASSRVLIDAATNGNIALVQQLLSVPGISVNIQDENGKTALMHAAKNGHRIIVMILSCVPGIDLSVKDNNGNTAAMHATQSGYSDIEKDLLAISFRANIEKLPSMYGMVADFNNTLSRAYFLTSISMFCVSVGSSIIASLLMFGRSLIRFINVSEFRLPMRGMAPIGQDAPLPAANAEYNPAAEDQDTLPQADPLSAANAEFNPAAADPGMPAQDAPLPAANAEYNPAAEDQDTLPQADPLSAANAEFNPAAADPGMPVQQAVVVDEISMGSTISSLSDDNSVSGHSLNMGISQAVAVSVVNDNSSLQSDHAQSMAGSVGTEITPASSNDFRLAPRVDSAMASQQAEEAGSQASVNYTPGNS